MYVVVPGIICSKWTLPAIGNHAELRLESVKASAKRSGKRKYTSSFLAFILSEGQWMSPRVECA
jgi:hypothetical protein